MTALCEDVRYVQNPALGAFLQWQYVNGYTVGRTDAAGCPLPLVFLVLPIVFHKQTEEYLDSTRRSSGLRAFSVKFGATQNNEGDLLLAIHDRAQIMRPLSLESIRTATRARLITVDKAAGIVHTLSTTTPKKGIPESVRSLAKSAEKFGYWSSQLTLLEIASILKVRF